MPAHVSDRFYSRARELNLGRVKAPPVSANRALAIRQFDSVTNAYKFASPTISASSSSNNINTDINGNSATNKDNKNSTINTNHPSPLMSSLKPTTTSLSNVATPQSNNSIRGKLTLRISEAHDLLVLGQSSNPYVVCTFNSSEFITHGSGSVPTSNASNITSTSIAIPSAKRSNHSSNLSLSGIYNKLKGSVNPPTNASPSGSATWGEEVQFDVTTEDAVLDISIYDADVNDAFLGRVHISINLLKNPHFDRILPLESRAGGGTVSGQVRVAITYEPARNRRIGPDDFEILRLVGKGTFGQVYQVRKKDTRRVYAMKVLSKKVIVQKKEIAHTIGERDILVRTALADSNFIVGLKFSFQTPSDLYLVTDYMSGGELFWHLQKEGRFAEDRAKFYIAELILALQHLHDNDIVYRDLKPENILLDANGHIALCDFGLSKANLSDNGTTNTFCGTTEYLAPEVLLDDKGYTKMVDFWSLGVLVFEMCCGWSPFYAEDIQQMYKNIAFGKVRFPKDALSPEGRNFVKGLLNRNPKNRLGANGDARELRAHPFFDDVDWTLLAAKKIPPPFKPVISGETDTSNFDPEFTQASTSVIKRGGFLPLGSTPLSPGIQANFQGFTYVDESSMSHLSATHHGDGMLGTSLRLGTSLKPSQFHDDDIDLYDDHDIENTVEYNTTHGLSNNKLLGEDEDHDVGMLDDDFIHGQEFEM